MISPIDHTPDDRELFRDRIKRALRTKGRLVAIERTGLLESAHEIPPLNRAVRLAAKALRTPVAQINVLTDKLLVPIAVYTHGEDDSERWETRRHVGHSFCKYVVWSKEPLQIDDAREHPLVKNSHATRELEIGAYLAAPIYAPADGAGERAIVGTVCAIDHAAREWTADDLTSLTDIAAGVSELIAARMRIRAQVLAGEHHAQRVLDALGVAVLASDRNGVTLYANPAAERLLGYSAEELVGHDRHALIHHSRPDGTRYPERDCPNSRARQEGRTHGESNDTYWRSDGKPITVDSMVTPIIEGGEVVGVVLSFRDVGELRAEEHREHDARLLAEAANRAKSEMLAAISHELRIPLIQIGEHTARLVAGLFEAATASQQEDLLGILRSQQHLLGLVENVQQFSTLESREKI
ncbi:MAG: PAS domain-containing protein [bacterium]